MPPTKKTTPTATSPKATSTKATRPKPSTDLEDRVRKDEQRQLDSVRRDLIKEFTTVPESTVVAELSQSTARFQGAPVRTFVPVLVQRSTRERLRLIA